MEVVDLVENPTSIKRRLVALAFADVAGFSRLIALNDVATVERWKAVRDQQIEPLMRRYGGRIAEIAGDAVLLEFGSVVDAVRWAVDVQRAQQARDDLSDPFSIKLRIGINVDDVIDDDGILQGDGVNIAARIHQAAEPGQIAVTARVRDYVANRLPLRFRDLGSPSLKNIVQPVRIFAIEWRDVGGTERLPQPYLQWSSKPTVAVLPFRNVSNSEDDAYFCEGITDEIITGLSRSRSLYVIARASTLRYRDRQGDKDMRQIASELDVRYLVDGSAWRQGSRLRIKVELLDVTGNQTIWSQRFDGGNDEVFAFQDRIATSIVGSFEPRLRAVEAARIQERPTDSLDAFDCVLKTMSRLYRFTDDSFRECDELLRRAIALDPNYAQAHAFTAWRLIFVQGECRSLDPVGDRLRGIAAAQRAIELDPDDAFVLSIAGHSHAFLSKQLDHANDLFDRALAVDGNSAFAWGLSALTQAYLGKPDEALGRLQNLWRLNPYDPLNFYFFIVAGIAEFVAGRYGEAIAWSRKSSRNNPRFSPALRTLAASLALSGDEEGARAVARDLQLLDPSFRVNAFVEWYPLRNTDDRRRLGEGLKAAGLPL